MRQALRVLIWGAVLVVILWQLVARQMLTEASEEGDRLASLQRLRVEATILQSFVQHHYDTHGALPYNLQTLECGPPSACAFQVWDGAIFLREGEDWLSFRPDFSNGGLGFSCQQTFRSMSLPYDARLACETVDRAALPFIWDH